MAHDIGKDRFLGCILGQAVGDALGSRYEGLPDWYVLETVGSARDIVKHTKGDTLCYTDDTQMMIGIAETLIAHGEINEATLCRQFVKNYDPHRGYGSGARKILEAMARGEDWRQIARTNFPGGSLGNGAAMRVAPVGLFFADDVDRLMEQARQSALPTHQHPLGIEGAQLLALAVALAARLEPFDKTTFFRQLLTRCQNEEFQWQVRTAATMEPHHTIGVLGSGIEAHRSVVTAIVCFARAPKSYADAIGTAISLGGDTDTLAAMAGAISGAHLGIQAIPPHLLGKLEDRSPHGRTYLHSLADRLYERYASAPA
jgi:poly(ADP-ribose) glycohydrolase ARH3